MLRTGLEYSAVGGFEREVVSGTTTTLSVARGEGRGIALVCVYGGWSVRQSHVSGSFSPPPYQRYMVRICSFGSSVVNTSLQRRILSSSAGFFYWALAPFLDL